jgi:hypothetical protein
MSPQGRCIAGMPTAASASPDAFIYLAYVGAAVLAFGLIVIVMGVGLLRRPPGDT